MEISIYAKQETYFLSPVYTFVSSFHVITLRLFMPMFVNAQDHVENRLYTYIAIYLLLIMALCR